MAERNVVHEIDVVECSDGRILDDATVAGKRFRWDKSSDVSSDNNILIASWTVRSGTIVTFHDQTPIARQINVPIASRTFMT
jgi:hypothetical protein